MSSSDGPVCPTCPDSGLREQHLEDGTRTSYCLQCRGLLIDGDAFFRYLLGSKPIAAFDTVWPRAMMSRTRLCEEAG